MSKILRTVPVTKNYYLKPKTDKFDFNLLKREIFNAKKLNNTLALILKIIHVKTITFSCNVFQKLIFDSFVRIPKIVIGASVSKNLLTEIVETIEKIWKRDG